MDIIVNEIKRGGLNSTQIKKVVNFLSKKERKIKGEVEINIVDNKEIKKLNKIYRGINSPTDVLSFAWQEEKSLKNSNFLGQIYLSAKQIKIQSKEYKVSEKEEFVRMLVHGLMHLIGFDHQKEREAKRMFQKQESYLKEIIKML